MGEALGELRRRIFALSFIDEFVPFVALFALWFEDNGVTVSQISTVFVLWALAVVVLEVPTGAIADRFDRRHLLASSYALRLAGISIWLVWPTFAGLIVGGALWALHDSFASGAWEAMIHDQLEAVGHAHDYARVMARTGQFSHGGTAVAALASIPLLAVGLDLSAMGWITVAIHPVAAVIVLRLPDVQWVVERSRAEAEEHGVSTFEAIRTVGDRAALALFAAAAGVGGLAIIDEYVPLLARDRGTSDAWIPLVFLVVWVGLILGGELAARRPDISSTRLAALVAAGGLAAVGAFLGDQTWMLIGIGLAYAAVEMTWVVTDARLQARTPSHVRATVTSLRELGTAIVAGVALVVIGVLTTDNDPTAGLVIVAVCLLASSALVAAIPDATSDDASPLDPDAPHQDSER